VIDNRQRLRDLGGGHPRDERRAWYAVRGADVDPSDVESLTGIPADRSWRAGDPRPRTGIARAEGLWLIFSGLGAGEEVHDHLDALLARMRPAWPAFADLGRRHEASVTVSIHCLEAQGPLVEVLPDVSAALAELNASLGFDLYALPEDEAPAVGG
jgi:hypothetical protein